jgi:muramoyltetrapeptide carboxypeptidase LdcA involved in peptidoglycan recycling
MSQKNGQIIVTPPALKKGDMLRIIAPTGGIEFLADSTISHAIYCLEKIGFKVSFAEHCKEAFEFNTASINNRLDDLHSAFKDDSVHGILSLIGGLNSIQLVSKIDYDLIKKNPKFFCGYSDITAVQNAITARSNIITYSGPHFQTFGIKHGNEFTVEHFLSIATGKPSAEFPVAPRWTDDKWYRDQENRTYTDNEGPYVISEGKAAGHIVGGNLSTLLLLSGTPYMPDFSDIILIAEEDRAVTFDMFDRMLESFLLAYGSRVRGIMIGRFQGASEVSKNDLQSILKTRPYLSRMPIIADMDFGHTNPMITLPIGASITIDTSQAHKIRLGK